LGSKKYNLKKAGIKTVFDIENKSFLRLTIFKPRNYPVVFLGGARLFSKFKSFFSSRAFIDQFLNSKTKCTLHITYIQGK
jgi:hypothetical protein